MTPPPSSRHWHLQSRTSGGWITRGQPTTAREGIQAVERLADHGTEARLLLGRQVWYHASPEIREDPQATAGTRRANTAPSAPCEA